VLLCYRSMCYCVLHVDVLLCVTSRCATMCYKSMCCVLQVDVLLCVTGRCATVCYKLMCYCVTSRCATVCYKLMCHCVLQVDVLLCYKLMCYCVLQVRPQTRLITLRRGRPWVALACNVTWAERQPVSGDERGKQSWASAALLLEVSNIRTRDEGTRNAYRILVWKTSWNTDAGRLWMVLEGNSKWYWTVTVNGIGG
jgi:hypothetical protein